MAYLTRGERFKDARTVHNQHGKQTMSKVQEGTGVSASLIADLEGDKKDRRVNYLDIANLAGHYGVTMDWLCGLTDDYHISPCAADELGLTAENVDFLSNPGLIINLDFPPDWFSAAVRCMANDVIEACIKERIYEEYKLISCALARDVEDMPIIGDLPSEQGVSRFLEVKGYLALSREETVDYLTRRIGDKISRYIVNKHLGEYLQKGKK